jgi:hypothetical protein
LKLIERHYEIEKKWTNGLLSLAVSNMKLADGSNYKLFKLDVLSVEYIRGIDSSLTLNVCLYVYIYILKRLVKI